MQAASPLRPVGPPPPPSQQQAADSVAVQQQQPQRSRRGRAPAVVPAAPHAAGSRGAPLPSPVYFLVKEQAKSLVAIKELQDRIRHLEESQGSIFEVVSELQLDFGRALLSKNPVVTSSNAVKAFARTRFNSDMDPKKNYSKDPQESTDNKQDSGVDSDCQAQLSVSHLSQPKSVLDHPTPANAYDRDDELLMLLEMISQRGAKLRQRVDEYEDQMQRPEQLETLSYQDVASLLSKCRGLQKRLKEAYLERDHLRSQLDLYESVVTNFREEKRRLEEKLDSAVHEKKQLETRIHRLHGQLVRGAQQDNWTSETKSATELEKAKRLKRRSLDENKTKISEVLKEKSCLELQRQLLHMILENESMAQTLAQSEEQRLAAASDWEKRELRMRVEIENLTKEKAELSRSLGQSRIDNTDVLAKVKLLERALQAVSQDTKMASQQLENASASVQKRRASAATYNQMMKATPPGGHVFQSLPPGVAAMPQSQMVYVENEIHPFVNTSGYLNISLDEPELEALERENPELDFRKCLPSNRSSTPITGNVTGKYTSKLEMRSGQTRCYQSEGEDMASLCGEFDPLSQVTEGKTLRVMEYVDSLDALPSNNVMFVPVSVAKVSLRDKPKYASPLVHRVSYPNVIQRVSGVQYPVQGLYHQMAANGDAGLL